MHHGPEGIPTFQYFFSFISTYPSFFTLLPPTPPPLSLCIHLVISCFSANLFLLSNAKAFFYIGVTTFAQNFVQSGLMKKHFVFSVLEQLAGGLIGSQLGSFGRKTGLGHGAGCHGFLSHEACERGSPGNGAQSISGQDVNGAP